MVLLRKEEYPEIEPGQYVAQLIRQGLSADKPILFVGYSYGGLVAREVKRQLNDLGFTKVYVAMVDTPTSAETSTTQGTFAPQTLNTINQHAKKTVQAPGTITVPMYTPAPGKHRQFLMGLYDELIHKNNFHVHKASTEAVTSFKADVEKYLLNLVAALEYTQDTEKLADSTGNEHVFVISSEELARAYGDPNLGWNVPDGNVSMIHGTTHDSMIDSTNAEQVAKVLVSKICRLVNISETERTIKGLRSQLEAFGGMNEQFELQLSELEAKMRVAQETLSSPPPSPPESVHEEPSSDDDSASAVARRGSDGTMDDAGDPFVQNSPTDGPYYSGHGFLETRSRPSSDAATPATAATEGRSMDPSG